MGTTATEEITPHLDNTKRSCFVECHRKYFYQYIKNIRPMYGSSALRYGLTWHAGMDAYYNHIKKFGWSKDGTAIQAAFEAMKKEWEDASKKESFYTDYRTLENCFTSFLQYIQHFAQDELILKVVRTEEPFKINMELETTEEHRLFSELLPFHFTGKIDAEIELNGREWINEHKTTGQSLDTQVNRLNRSAQVLGYFYAKKRIHRGEKSPEGVLMTIHHLSARRSTAKGNEGNYGTPKIDFRRVPQVFSDNDIRQWRLSFLGVALEIQRETERQLWPMNHDSCFNYGSCPYLALCEQSASASETYIDEQRYYIAEPWEVAKSITASSVIN